MDYSLNKISFDKKLRFYCGDKIHIYDSMPSNLKDELWWSDKSYQRAIREMRSELQVISDTKGITLTEARRFLYGVGSTQS
jgi:hypothetical protein